VEDWQQETVLASPHGPVYRTQTWVTTALVEVKSTAHHYGSSDIDVTGIVLYFVALSNTLVPVKSQKPVQAV